MRTSNEGYEQYILGSKPWEIVPQDGFCRIGFMDVEYDPVTVDVDSDAIVRINTENLQYVLLSPEILRHLANTAEVAAKMVKEEQNGTET